MSKQRIAIFASGSGSNAQKIMEHFQHHPHIEVALLLSNNKEAYALQRAANFNIPTAVFDRQQFRDNNEVIEWLHKHKIDFVVLAGFLWLVPQNLVTTFRDKIINIHPSLLPKFGGKGMYGDYVHQAVLTAQEKQSGITIHYVNEHFDEGKIIFQAKFEINTDDTLENVREKCHSLEHLHFPRVIEEVLTHQI